MDFTNCHVELWRQSKVFTVPVSLSFFNRLDRKNDYVLLLESERRYPPRNEIKRCTHIWDTSSNPIFAEINSSFMRKLALRSNTCLWSLWQMRLRNAFVSPVRSFFQLIFPATILISLTYVDRRAKWLSKRLFSRA